MEVEVKIRGLMMDPSTNSPIVILKDVNSETMLPIWVGHFEAHAIALEIEKVTPQRPLTHDLIRNLMKQVGAELRRIVVTKLVDNTFYAVIEYELNGQTMILDSRPSDAIALALRTDAQIFVNSEVIENSQNTILAKSDEATDLEAEGEAETQPLDAEAVEWPDEIDTDPNKYKM